VLVGIDDVAAGVSQEAADSGNEPGLIGAGKQQARGWGLAVDARMIARLRAGSLSSTEAAACDSRLF